MSTHQNTPDNLEVFIQARDGYHHPLIGVNPRTQGTVPAPRLTMTPTEAVAPGTARTPGTTLSPGAIPPPDTLLPGSTLTPGRGINSVRDMSPSTGLTPPQIIESAGDVDETQWRDVHSDNTQGDGTCSPSHVNASRLTTVMKAYVAVVGATNSRSGKGRTAAAWETRRIFDNDLVERRSIAGSSSETTAPIACLRAVTGVVEGLPCDSTVEILSNVEWMNDKIEGEFQTWIKHGIPKGSSLSNIRYWNEIIEAAKDRNIKLKSGKISNHSGLPSFEDLADDAKAALQFSKRPPFKSKFSNQPEAAE